MAKSLGGNSQWKIIKKFCNNTTIPAGAYLIRNSKCERVFWIIVIFSSLLCTIFLTRHIVHEWSSESVFISLDASSYSINDVNFPAVSICNINKISKHRAQEFAYNLSRIVPSGRNQTEIFYLIRLIGNLYDLNINEAQDFVVLQEVLEVYLRLSQEEFPFHLRALSTPCNEILLNCSWNSVFYNCSDLFTMRLTDSGFCCVFNSVRPLSKDNVYKIQFPKKPRHFSGTGVAKGLSVTVYNNISDYFYTDLATRGYLVKIFSPADFPDLSSGSLKQIIVQEESEVFVKLEANTLKSQEQIRVLPINLRKCKFSDEGKTGLRKYTSSNCFVSCKIKSILSLCNCVPFMLPIEIAEFDEVISFCTLIDIPCLNKYRDKWLRYYPFEAHDINELNLETDDSLHCDCWANCNEVTYSIDTNYLEYYSKNPVYQNSSRIHVFSNKAYTNLYKKMVTVTWYEALSTFGGIVSLFLGISIINLMEIAVCALKVTPQGEHHE